MAVYMFVRSSAIPHLCSTYCGQLLRDIYGVFVYVEHLTIDIYVRSQGNAFKKGVWKYYDEYMYV